MKKQLTVALGLAVIAAPAFATKARLEALGEDNYGSYYINDNRNMFLNPARINDHKDTVNYEFGTSGAGGSVTDSTAAPKAEGGFTKGHGNMVYGLQFGNTSPQVGLVRGLAGTGGTGGSALSERQPWDLFVGGDAGMKWGANFTYENHDSGRADSDTRISSSALRTRLGVVMGDLDVFAHVSLNNKANNHQGGMVDGDLGYLIGASQMVNNYRLFAEWRQINAEYRSDAAVAAGGTASKKEDFKYNQLRLGAARQERLNDKASLFAKVMIVRQTAEDDGGFLGGNASNTLGTGNGFAAAGDATIWTAPLTLGTEYNATSWLDLRASISQNVYSNVETDPKGGGAAGKKASGHIANTAVRAGASIKFGEFSVDGLLSTANDGDAANTTDGSTAGGNLRTDKLMTRVSMIYRF